MIFKEIFILLLFVSFSYQIQGNLKRIVLRQNKASREIIGGVDATKSDWRFITIVTCGQVHLCGGTLLRPTWVLTAAHCVHDELINTEKNRYGPLAVRLGTDDLDYVKSQKYVVNENQKTRKGYVSVIKNEEILSIDKIILHPEYFFAKKVVSPTISLKLMGNDIALIKLSKVPRNVTLVNLASTSVSATSSCKTAGWGAKKLGKEKSKTVKNVLQELHFTLLPHKACSDTLEQVVEALKPSDIEAYYHKLHKLCSNAVKSRQGIFSGDTGGPLICNNELQGISSQILVHGNLSSPSLTSLFTDISYYIDWINDTFIGDGEPGIPDYVFKNDGDAVDKNSKYLAIFLSVILLTVY